MAVEAQRCPSVRPSWISNAEIVASSDAAQYCASIYMHGIFQPTCRQDGAYGRSWALKRKRKPGDGHDRDDTDVQGGRGELGGFVEGSTNAAMGEQHVALLLRIWLAVPGFSLGPLAGMIPVCEGRAGICGIC
jgi:hypothetical protein